MELEAIPWSFEENVLKISMRLLIGVVLYQGTTLVIVQPRESALAHLSTTLRKGTRFISPACVAGRVREARVTTVVFVSQSYNVKSSQVGFTFAISRVDISVKINSLRVIAFL